MGLADGVYVGSARSGASNQTLSTTGRLFRPSPRVDDQDSEVAPAYHHPATPDGSTATEPLAFTDLFLSRPHGNGVGRILVPAPRRSLPRSGTALGSVNNCKGRLELHGRDPLPSHGVHENLLGLGQPGSPVSDEGCHGEVLDSTELPDSALNLIIPYQPGGKDRGHLRVLRSVAGCHVCLGRVVPRVREIPCFPPLLPGPPIPEDEKVAESFLASV